MEAAKIETFTAWPSHDNNDRIDFGNSDIEVISNHFKDIRENNDVKIGGALTEWGTIKSNFMVCKLKQANINNNHL